VIQEIVPLLSTPYFNSLPPVAGADKYNPSLKSFYAPWVSVLFGSPDALSDLQQSLMKLEESGNTFRGPGTRSSYFLSLRLHYAFAAATFMLASTMSSTHERLIALAWETWERFCLRRFLDICAG